MANEEQDEILAEVRRVRDEYAKSHNYDLDKIYQDIKRREAESGKTFVRRSPKPVSRPEDEAA